MSEYNKQMDRIHDLGFGKIYGWEPFNRAINHEKLLGILGEKFPPDCFFCAVNRHIDVYSPKDHETHRGAAAVNLKNLIDYLENLK